MSAPSDSRRTLPVKSKAEVIHDALRIGHDLGVRAHALATSPHPLLALEQLEAELDSACHLVRDVRRLIEEHQKVSK